MYRCVQTDSATELNKQQVHSENPGTGESHSNLAVLLCCTSPSINLNLLSEQFPKSLALHTFSTDMQYKMYTQQNTTTVHTVSSEYLQLISTTLRSIRSSSGRRLTIRFAAVNYKHDCRGASHVT
jgi:hypothetical protein